MPLEDYVYPLKWGAASEQYLISREGRSWTCVLAQCKQPRRGDSGPNDTHNRPTFWPTTSAKHSGVHWGHQSSRLPRSSSLNESDLDSTEIWERVTLEHRWQARNPVGCMGSEYIGDKDTYERTRVRFSTGQHYLNYVRAA